ncbi:MAG: hypothetical protein JNG84_05720, partial [Archangium sp.]|nr:hypothetical protein [Archangium sp.]
MLSSLVALVSAAAVFHPTVTTRQATPTGQPRFEAGVLSAPLPGELSSAVEAWALSNREAWGLPATSTLKHSHAFGTRFGASFHLRQYVGATEVYGARLVVTLDTNRQVVQISSSLVPHARAVDGAVLDEAPAMRLAAKAIPFPALRADGLPYGGATRRFFDVGTELHQGFLIHVASVDYSKNWYVAVDAVTGEVLFTQNRVHTAALDADVYALSPGGLDAGVGRTPTIKTELRHTDGGSMVADTCDTFLSDGGWATTPNTASNLCGHQLTQFNCCPSEGCQPDAGAKRVTGTTQFPIGPASVAVAYDIGVCDRLRRASSSTNDAGSFEYPPVDPPANPTTVVASDPANSDEFAEVNSFFHLNRVYDWVRGLSASAQGTFSGHQPAVSAFAMRDERRTPSRKPAVWANVMFPNFNELQSSLLMNPTCFLNPPCMARATTLSRIDNAAFFPREQFAQLPLPGFDTGVDTLMIFQGNAADAAYDATVLEHELGHGVVYATAELTFDTAALDSRSANNESGALHEGFADYIAAAFNDEPNIGPYFGPRASAGMAIPGVRQDAYLRSLTNTLTCPDVLWGQVHQDSQHVSAAL